MKYRPFLLRWGTQDLMAAQEVLVENQYALPYKFSPEDVIIDVGAHVGCFALACLERGCGKVICYEPDGENFVMLQKNMESWKTRCDVHYNAVWRNTGYLKLTQNPKPGMTAMSHTLFGEGNDVPAITLNAILKENPNVRLLKLDCEGAEKPILDSVDNLDHVEEVIGEIHYGMPVTGEDPPMDSWLRKRLSQLGFHYPKIVPSKTCPALVGMFWATRK